MQESWSGTPLVLSSAGPRLLHRNQDVDGFLGFCVWRAYPVGMYREGVEGLNDSSSGTSAPQSQYPERRLRGQTIHSRLNSFMCYIAGWAGQGSRCVWAAAVNCCCNRLCPLCAFTLTKEESCVRGGGGGGIYIGPLLSHVFNCRAFIDDNVGMGHIHCLKNKKNSDYIFFSKGHLIGSGGKGQVL